MHTQTDIQSAASQSDDSHSCASWRAALWCYCWLWRVIWGSCQQVRQVNKRIHLIQDFQVSESGFGCHKQVFLVSESDLRCSQSGFWVFQSGFLLFRVRVFAVQNQVLGVHNQGFGDLSQGSWCHNQVSGYHNLVVGFQQSGFCLSQPGPGLGG